MNVLVLLSVLLHATSIFCQSHISLKLNGTPTTTQTVSCNHFKYYEVNVNDPCKDLQITVTVVEGEPNVYVSRGNTQYPNERSLAWTSYNWGSEILTISSWDPEFSIGPFYIGVQAYCGGDVLTQYTDAKFTLQVNSVESTHPNDEIRLNGTANGLISANQYQYYRFCISSSCNNIEVKLDNCIDQETCPTSYAWPELLVSRSIVRPTINDHSWKLATIERRSVYLLSDDTEFYPGHYFIGVYGWCTPQESCIDDSICGPCKYVNNHTYAVSVKVTDVVGKKCTPKGPLQLCETSQNGVGMANSLATTNIMLSVIVLFGVTRML